MSKINETSGAAGVMGYQLPIGIVKRKKKVDELLQSKKVSVSEVSYFFKNISEDECVKFEQYCSENNDSSLCELIKSKIVEKYLREFVSNKVREVVRKLPGGAGFALFSPNQGKKRPSKKIATFPTKLAARSAELARFPPKDPRKLNRMKKELDKLKKDPKAAKEKEKQARKEKPDAKYGNRINKDREKKSVKESLFREEAKPSEWDQYVLSLSKQSVLADKAFQEHQKNILKKSEKALNIAVKEIKKELESNKFSLNDKGLKKDVDKQEMYYEFSAGDKEGASEVGPIYVFVRAGIPEIEFSDNAKASLTKIQPERSKALRHLLINVQEDALDNIQDVKLAIEKRDNYLSKLEGAIDNMVADLSPLEITMLKNLLVKKYRKIS